MMGAQCSCSILMSEPRDEADEVAPRINNVIKGTLHRWIEMRGLPAHPIFRPWNLQPLQVKGRIRCGGTADVLPASTPRRKGRR